MPRRAGAVAIISAIFLSVLTSLASPAQAAPAIRIDVIHFDPLGSDTGENYHLNREWIRIKNTSGVSRDITGWRVRDAAGHVYTFPRTILGPGGTVTLRTGAGTNAPGVRYWGQDWYVWNNSGDKGALRNSSGALIHTCQYFAAAEKSKTCT